MQSHCHSPLHETTQSPASATITPAAAADHLAKLSLYPASSAAKRRPPSLQEPNPKKQQLRCCISDVTPSPEKPSNTLLWFLSDPTKSPNLYKIEKKQSPSSKKLRKIRTQMRKLIQRWENDLEDEERIENSGGFDNLSNNEGERETGDSQENRGKQSPSSMKLNMIRYQMKGLIQRLKKILNEEERNNEDGGICNSRKDEGERETKEAVSVEKTEDGCLLIHCNCPCKKAFKLLILGNDCCYKFH